METRHRLTTGVAGSRRLLKREPTTEAAQFPDRMIGSWVSPACPPDIAQQFWDYVQAIEREHDTLPFDLLVASGVALPFPDDLDNARLTDKLWEVVVALSAVGVYLHSTDRLSDRDLYAYLYAYLWKEALRQPATILPDNPSFAYHIDLISSGSEEDILLFLKYYADGDARRSWAVEWPDLILPNREPRPFDRDRRLPRPRNE